MRSRYDAQLSQLNNELIEMGSLIEKAIEMSVTSLAKKDRNLAQDTIAFDDKVNKQERLIEHLCMKLLMQQQPVAKDLRFISSALKMITDMERIGDQAADIAEITVFLVDQPYLPVVKLIQQMAKATMVMVVESIDAFVDRNLEKAECVIKSDDEVDGLFVTIKQELIKTIQSDAGSAEQATDLLMIAKYFERIGDHATNIGEWVIYAITGSHENSGSVL